MTYLPVDQPASPPSAARAHGFRAPPGGFILVLETEMVARARTAYQQDGRLAAAATVRQQNPALSMSEALSMIDRALGIRKPPAIL